MNIHGPESETVFKIGDRVGAVCSADDSKGVLELFGYGTFQGCVAFEIEEDVGVMVITTTPKLQLDNGDIVYGYECWWGTEEVVKKQESLFEEVRVISVDQYRKEVSDILKDPTMC